MLALLQRVSQAAVDIDGAAVAQIDNGLLVLVGFEKDDDESVCARAAERIIAYRIFEDGEQRMNLSVKDCGGALLLVPQFTLAADTRKGNRPGVSSASPPEIAKELFDRLVECARREPIQVECGRFGADMDVRLINRGPATFLLRIAPR